MMQNKRGLMATLFFVLYFIVGHVENETLRKTVEQSIPHQSTFNIANQR